MFFEMSLRYSWQSHVGADAGESKIDANMAVGSCGSASASVFQKV